MRAPWNFPRRASLMAALLAMAMLLAACASSDPAASSPQDDDTPVAAETSDDGEAGSESEAAPGPRVVAHAMGETTIEGTPQRVVVLDTGELDSAVALGITPVGAVVVSDSIGFPDYLADAVADVTEVGTIAEPNLETIASLQPDLILSSKSRHEAIYPQLSQIAPTVFTEQVGVTWRENFELHAEALGMTDQANGLLDTYDTAVADLATALGDDLPEVSIIRSLGEQIRIMMKASFIGTIIDDVGLPRPAPQDQDVFMEEGNLERVPDMDGDLIIISRFGDEHGHLEQIMDSPAWQDLRAVQTDNVHEVDDSYWMLGIGIGAAQLVIDDLTNILDT